MNDYERIERIIGYIDQHQDGQPGLSELADVIGLSQYHFHRLFSRWAGVTPKDFLQCLTMARARAILGEGRSVLDTSLDVGLSGPGRLHDLCVTLEAASPGELKSGGAALTVRCGFADSPFGTCLVGESARGVCHLSFVSSLSREAAIAEIESSWPNADVFWDDSVARGVAAEIFHTVIRPQGSEPLRAFVRGSKFQVRVWRALLKVPCGSLVSYGQIAESMGNRSSARAVGTAVARNPLAYLIPCHRVIQATGVVGRYRWNARRKRAIIAWESARNSA